ncbi:MAG: hypothetical protein ACRYF1_06390 [Janthinobacterium lividum]
MRHHSDLSESDTPSLGIVAVNAEQRELLIEELVQRCAHDALVERYKDKVKAKGEPFFVKNLETCRATRATTSSSP